MGVCLLLAMPLEGFAAKQDIEEVYDNATESYESEDYRADDEDSSCVIASALASLAECHTGEVNDIAPQRSETPDFAWTMKIYSALRLQHLAALLDATTKKSTASPHNLSLIHI